MQFRIEAPHAETIEAEKRLAELKAEATSFVDANVAVAAIGAWAHPSRQIP